MCIVTGNILSEVQFDLERSLKPAVVQRYRSADGVDQSQVCVCVCVFVCVCDKVLR